RAWNAPIYAYGPAFAHTPNLHVQLAPGDDLRLVYVRCDFDETGTQRPATCRAVDRATFLLTGTDPTYGAFWTWAKHTFAISDARPLPEAIDRLTGTLRVSQNTDLGPRTIVALEYTFWLMVDEILVGSCTTDGPCDPAPVPTGRKILGFERMNLV